MANFEEPYFDEPYFNEPYFNEPYFEEYENNYLDASQPTFKTKEEALAYAKEQENLAKQSNISKNVDVTLSQNISQKETDIVEIKEKDIAKIEVENKNDIDLILTNRNYWYKDFKNISFTKAKVSLKGDLAKIRTKIQGNEQFYILLLKSNEESDFPNSILLNIKATAENKYLADLYEKFLQGQKPFAVNLTYDLSIENKKIDEKNFILNYDENLLQISQEQKIQQENVNYEQIVNDEIVRMEKIIQKYKNYKGKFIGNNDSIYKVLQKTFNKELNTIGTDEKFLLNFVTKYYAELTSFSQERNNSFFKNLINPKTPNLCCVLKNKNAKNVFNQKLNLIESFIHSKINKDKMILSNQREQQFNKIFNKNTNNNYSQIAKIFNNLENTPKKYPKAKQSIDFKDIFKVSKPKQKDNENTKSISKVVQENFNLDEISLKTRNYGILGASLAGVGALLASVSSPIAISIIAGLGALTAVATRFGVPHILEQKFLIKNKQLNQALQNFFNDKNNIKTVPNNENDKLDDLIKQLDRLQPKF